MRFLEYMGFVLAVFPLKYGFIIVQVCVPTRQCMCTCFTSCCVNSYTYTDVIAEFTHILVIINWLGIDSLNFYLALLDP